jgi:uncharacterized protein (DUF3820 family)
MTLFPFGQYRGERFENIPENYLEWLLRQAWLNDFVYREVQHELVRRGSQFLMAYRKRQK